MLQRLTEDFEYAYVLDIACEIKDDLEELAYVAAFAISPYSTGADRTLRPFNPLYGETYECDRRIDLGWRSISEMVCRNPPTIAMHCEGNRWTYWMEYTDDSKFYGDHARITPKAVVHLELYNGNHYTWKKIPTLLNSVISGKMWMDHYGQMTVVNVTMNQRANIYFEAHDPFNLGIKRRVYGTILDEGGYPKWKIDGTWDKQLEIRVVLSAEGARPREDAICELGGPTLVWEKFPRQPGNEKFYNFSLFACQLNQKERAVAPTDTRFRPDIRLYEQGDVDTPNYIKEELELYERIRAERREVLAREKSAYDKRSLITLTSSYWKSKSDSYARLASTAQMSLVKSNLFAESVTITTDLNSPYDYEPVWFKKEVDPMLNIEMYRYQGTYWKCKEKRNWSRCPDIFSKPEDKPEPVSEPLVTVLERQLTDAERGLPIGELE